MPYIRPSKTLKANSFSLFSLFVIFGFVILPTVVLRVGKSFLGAAFIPDPIASAEAEMQEPLYNNLPVVQTIPAVPVDALVKDVDEKVVVVVPKSVQDVSAAHLKIPRIGVDAVIKEMGLTSDGAMAVPGNRVDVGWYNHGPRPGKKGSAVIGGHNAWDSGAGVFAHLDQLKKGDVLSVVDAKGISISFVVRSMRTYDATDTNSGIFESKIGVHLNLITCSGSWDPKTKTYTKRLVILTDRCSSCK